MASAGKEPWRRRELAAASKAEIVGLCQRRDRPAAVARHFDLAGTGSGGTSPPAPQN
jgi:hypothetical protein